MKSDNEEYTEYIHHLTLQNPNSPIFYGQRSLGS